MGSLTSRPKVLPVQQPEVITLTSTAAPATTTDTTDSTTTSSASTGTTTTGTTATTSDTAAATRAANLQERSDGLLSTVLTGFDGVLSNTNSTTPQRKSLLGE